MARWWEYRLDESLCRGLNNFALTIENWMCFGEHPRTLLAARCKEDSKRDSLSFILIFWKIHGHSFANFWRFIHSSIGLCLLYDVRGSSSAMCLSCLASKIWVLLSVEKTGGWFFFGFAGDLVDLFPWQTRRWQAISFDIPTSTPVTSCCSPLQLSLSSSLPPRWHPPRIMLAEV